MAALDPAIHAFLKIPIDQKTEHSDRAALENLLNALKPQSVHVQQGRVSWPTQSPSI